MNLLKKENCFFWLLLTIIGQGTSIFALAILLDCVDKDAWYMKWQNWALGLVCFLFPFAIMISVFTLQLTCQVAAKLNLPGSELYLSPYLWLIMIIIPFLGWLAFVALILYLEIGILVMLYKREGEKYIK